MKKKNLEHFNHARKTISSWPEWKRKISIKVPQSKFNVDGVPYK